MLAVTEADGHVSGSIPGMAAIARLSLQDTKTAIDRLCAPDPYSRSLEFEGRRIAEAPGGWQILNYDKYRASRDEDERKAYMREYMQNYRKQNRKPSKPKVNSCKPPLAQAEAEAEAEAEAVKEKSKKKINHEDSFEKFWKAYPKKVGRLAAQKAWTKAHMPPIDEILKAIENQKKSKSWIQEDGQYIPNPSTWLNQGRWNDELPIEGPKKITNENYKPGDLLDQCAWDEDDPRFDEIFKEK